MKNKERFGKVKKLVKKLFKEEFKKNPEDIETVEEFLKLNKILRKKKNICLPITDFFYRKKII